MVVMTAVTMLWFAFSLSFIDSTFEVPQMIVRGMEPLQKLLVHTDIESEQLTNRDLEDPTENKRTKRTAPVNNMIFVQVVDKLLFALFLILVIVLHN